MEKCKDGENAWIDGCCRLEKYKDGDMKDGNVDGEVQIQQECMDMDHSGWKRTKMTI